ncbi:hypothetical protein BGX38DRAFT_1329426 [Terfezia claveryi]|nr:hypothetical protein BGX38DRAFT_1329426 [Terfezia claveryi]
MGVMPVPEALANMTSMANICITKSKSASSASQYRNWTLLLMPNTPTVILSQRRRTESKVTVYPNLTAGNTSSAKQPKIVVHWLERSRAQRIVWLLEEQMSSKFTSVPRTTGRRSSRTR